MRLLDSQKINYHAYEYCPDNVPSGVEVAKLLNQNPEHVFKTLVTVGASHRNYVFVIPVGEELSLKKAAAVAHEKKIEMVKSKELLALTGYIHGGCSPIGMKKTFATFVDETVLLCETMIFSAGKVGFQVEITPADLKRMINYSIEDVIQ